jgi:hypothetical protein
MALVATWVRRRATAWVVAELASVGSGRAEQGLGLKVLMPSTPAAYPQVISRAFASFRVPKFRVSAAQGNFWVVKLAEIGATRRDR